MSSPVVLILVLLPLVSCSAPPTTVAPTLFGTVRPSGTEVTTAMVNGHFDVRIGPIALRLAKDAGVDLVAATESALHRVDSVLPGPRVGVVIEVDPANAIPEVGIGGSADPRSGNVRVSLAASPPSGWQVLVRDWLPATLAHELHHSRRVLRGPGYGRTIGEAVITEGLAEAFVYEAFPNTPLSPWARALDQGEQRRTLALLRSVWDLTDTSSEHRRWFFGSSDLPRWTGYTLGFEMVASYVRLHSGARPSLLVTENALRIFRESGYNP